MADAPEFETEAPDVGPAVTSDMFDYVYSDTTGVLYFTEVQDLPNAFGPSLLGDCKEDSSGRGTNSACTRRSTRTSVSPRATIGVRGRGVLTM